MFKVKTANWSLMTVISVNDGDFPNKLTSKLLERREKRGESREMWWAEGWVAEGRVRGGRERATPQFQYLFVCNWWPQRELTRIFLHCTPPPPPNTTSGLDHQFVVVWSKRRVSAAVRQSYRSRSRVPVFYGTVPRPEQAPLQASAFNAVSNIRQ